MNIIKQNKKILLFAFLVAVVVMVRFSGLGDVIGLEKLKRYRELLVTAVKDNYALSVLAFIVVYITVAALSIPGAELLTLAGGFLYGVPLTTLYVNIGATVGAMFAFLAVRYLIGDWVQKKFEQQLSAFNDQMDKNGAEYLLTLRLIPVFPFFLINLLSGLTKVPLRTFVWTTALGIIPGTAVYAYAGQQIGSLNSVREILSARVAIAFILLALFAIFPVVLHHVKRAKNHP